MRKKLILILLLIAGFIACKEKLSLPDVLNNSNYLVVEGFINVGANDSTLVKLSRTVKLNSTTTLAPETRATVTIERNDGFKLTLFEFKPGNYFMISNLALDDKKQYRLRIKTAAGKEYVSDFVEAKVAQPIDKLNWTVQNDGLHINVSTHDDTQKSVYYKWDFVETFTFRTEYRSLYKVSSNQIVSRDLVNDDISLCWRTNNSSNIVLGSSARLNKDVIADFPVTIIAQGAEKTGIRYSILVKQKTLPEDAFNFWQNLKKNTEQVGSIFDAQPSQLQGNIHSLSNANEIVIGYISAGTVQTKRLFVDNGELPNNFIYRPAKVCALDTVLNAQLANYFFRGNVGSIPVERVYDGDILRGYTASESTCVDCTLKGTNKKPSFWQ